MKTKVLLTVLVLIIPALFILSDVNITNAQTDIPWPMAGANPQRTSWVPDGPKGQLAAIWAKPLVPYISQKVQIIGAEGKLFVSTSKGLYAINSDTGALVWTYPTDMPLGHSPTYANGILYVGGLDRKLHAVNAANGEGLWTYQANGGFHTNPVVVDGVVYLGSRDGVFHAINAEGTSNAGKKKWLFPADGSTIGAIKFSAAYANGTLYVPSDDSYVYAINASTGAQVWKTKVNVKDFHSWWPVIYQDGTNNALVITGMNNYRATIQPGDCENNLCSDTIEEEVFKNQTAPAPTAGPTPTGPLPTSPAVPEGEFIAPLGKESYRWTPGTPTFDLSKSAPHPNAKNTALTEYLEKREGWMVNRAKVMVLNLTNGQEMTWDYDNDTKKDYAPFITSGAHGNGTPVVVNGNEKILYGLNGYMYSGAIAASGPTGWKFGTPHVSLVTAPSAGSSDDLPYDEPNALSGGGSMLYWNLCCDRFVGGVDTSIPLTNFNQQITTRQWRYSSSPGSPPPAKIKVIIDGNEEWIETDNQLPDGYHNEAVKYYWDINNANYYYEHQDQAAPTVYDGRIYVHRSNAIIAFGPGKPSDDNGVTFSSAPIQSAAVQQPRLESVLKQQLVTEVQKIINAGHLRPGYWEAGIVDFRAGFIDEWSADYFHNPADTFYYLLRAYPYLNSTLQTQVKTYLTTEYNNFQPYKWTHVGWKTGAPREAAQTPPEIVTQMSQIGPSNSNAFDGWKNNPFNYYALWQIAKAGIDTPAGILNKLNQATNVKLNVPGDGKYPNDDYFTWHPHVMNAYIAGYTGYVNLKQMTAQTPDSNIVNELNRLKSLRVSIMNWDLQSKHGNVHVNRYYYANRPAWNFMYMVPELAQYLKQNAAPKVQTAINIYQTQYPYWFISKPDDVHQGETDYNMLHNAHSMFQAKAQILGQSYTELEKYVDVPAFAVGDYYYIDNLVSAIEASGNTTPPTNGPTITPSLLLGDINGDKTVNIQDYTLFSNAFGTNNSASDLDGNGIVNIQDFTILSNNFGKSSL